MPDLKNIQALNRIHVFGYEGMYKVILKLKDNTSTEKNEYVGYDILKKIISCKDCDKEAEHL